MWKENTINKYWIYINRNLQIIKDSQTKCVKEWIIEIKSCVWHNLLKANFTPHTFTMVLWDLWTSTSQDKMIFSKKKKHTRSCSVNYSMPLSLSLTQNKWTKISLREFSLKSSFSWIRDNETICNLKLKHCFRNICYIQTYWLKIK